jgi:hypothetical protein
MKFKLLAATAALAVASLSSTAANAAVTITIEQVGPNVVATVGGSLNLTGATSLGVQGVTSGINSGLAVYTAVAGTGDNYSISLSGPANFGSSVNNITTTTVFAGDVFRMVGVGDIITVPLGYTSGSTLFATSTFSNRTLASLGLQIGSYVYVTPSDTITVNIGAMSAAVPEPSTWAMMLLGFGAIGASMRRARRAKALLQMA